jgi:pimeloyl-ACP methyl ester carboxylesterase
MAIARVGDINIEHYVEGAGPPLLMIMGLGGQAASWGEPFLDEMRRRFRIVRLSNRGTGQSDNPKNEVTVRAMADDAAGLLRELGIGRMHVFGISMGGMISQELVLNHPEVVQGLVLGCTNCGPPHSVAVPADTIAKFGQSMNLPVEERVRSFWRMTVSPQLAETGSAFLEQMITEAVLATPEYAAKIQMTMALQMAAVSTWDTYDRLPQVNAPTLIVHGDEDLLVPVENAEVLRSRIAGSRVRIIKDTGHCFFWEKPEEVAEVVSEFLAAVPAAA